MSLHRAYNEDYKLYGKDKIMSNYDRIKLAKNRLKKILQRALSPEYGHNNPRYEADQVMNAVQELIDANIEYERESNND